MIQNFFPKIFYGKERDTKAFCLTFFEILFNLHIPVEMLPHSPYIIGITMHTVFLNSFFIHIHSLLRILEILVYLLSFTLYLSNCVNLYLAVISILTYYQLIKFGTLLSILHIHLLL